MRSILGKIKKIQLVEVERRVEKVMDGLRFYESRVFPRAELEEAIANPRETTGLLLEEFDAFLADPAIVLSDPDYMLHMYGVYLLAQFRVEEAFPRIIGFVSWPADTLDYTLGDVVTEDLSSILYSTFNGDFELLKEVIQNPSIYYYVRDAALATYAQLHADGQVEDEEFYAYLRGLLSDKQLMGEKDVSEMVQGVVMEFQLFELLEEVESLYDAGRIDERLAGKYDEFLDFVYYYSSRESSVVYIDDVISEMQGWGFFDPSEEMERELAEKRARLEKEFRLETEKTKPAEKVGRNDPCPCGSGKKYKKCCFKKDAVPRQKKQEPASVQERWLEYYPKVAGERKPREIFLTDRYEESAIAIDRLVYLALRHRSRPIWEEVNEEKERVARVSYLSEGLKLFIGKMETERMESFEAYDRKHKIHYSSRDWIERFKRILVVNDLEDEYEKEFAKVDEVLKKYS